jgi:hypothetical protein
VLIVLLILVSIFELISAIRVFQKAGEPGWAIFVPFYNSWVTAQIGDRPGYVGLLACAVGVIPYAGPFLALGLGIYIAIGIAHTFGHGIWFGLGLYFLWFIFIPILAFVKDKSTDVAFYCYKRQE